MIKKWVMPGVLALWGCTGCNEHTASATAPRYQLEQVVMVMRHGVRSQTDSEMLARETGRTWPRYATQDGVLTTHGAEGVASQMAWLVSQWRAAGLPLEDGCPERQIFPWSSPTPRARDTGEAALEAMFPGCGFHTYYSTRSHDPVMKGQKITDNPLDVAKLSDELQHAAGGSVAALGARYQQNVDHLRQWGCASSGCSFMDEPWAANIKDNKVSFNGPLKHAGNMVETIRLQYSEGLPLDQVAFGHVQRAEDVTELMELQATSYALGKDLPEIARHGGSALMGLLTHALQTGRFSEQDSLSRPLVMFFAHDTNISQLRTMMGFDWQLPGYPHNDIPPAGALIFERFHDRQADREMIRISFQARSLDQWRHLFPLSTTSPLLIREWQFPGCEQTSVGVLCPLSEAVKRMSQQQDIALQAPADYFTDHIARALK